MAQIDKLVPEARVLNDKLETRVKFDNISLKLMFGPEARFLNETKAKS